MEVSLLGAEGLPKGCLLSVRAGTTRRQAPVDENKFRLSFPKGLQNAEPMKIDLLAPLGGAMTTFENGVERYELSVGHKGQSPMNVTLKVRNESHSCNDEHEVIAPAKLCRPASTPDLTASKLCRPASTPDFTAGLLSADKNDEASAGRRHRAAVAARRYLDDHKLLHWSQDLFQDLIREQPSDPWEFIVNKAQHSRKTAGFAPPQEPTCNGEFDPMTLHMSQASNPPGGTLRAVAPSNEEATQQAAVDPVGDPQIPQCRDDAAGFHCNNAEAPCLVPCEQPDTRAVATKSSQVGEEATLASQPQQLDIEMLRKNTREAFARAATDGILEETMNSVERDHLIPATPQISDTSCETSKECGDHNVNDVRGCLRGILSRAHLNGSLPTALEPCQAAPDDGLADVHPLRLRVRDMLLQANRNSKLSSVLAPPSRASAACIGTPTTPHSCARLVQTSAPDIEGSTRVPVAAHSPSVTKLSVIRKQTREVLLNGVTSEKLSTLLQETRMPDQPTPGTKACQTEDNMLCMEAREALRMSGPDGSLATLLSQGRQQASHENADLQESRMLQDDAAPVREQARRILVQSSLDGRLEAALGALMPQTKEQDVQNVETLRQEAKQALKQALVEVSCNGRLSAGTVQDAQSLRQGAKQALVQAHCNGRLFAAVAKVCPKEEGIGQETQVLRQEAKQALVRASCDGRLSAALAEVHPRSESMVQDAQALRQGAKHALVRAKRDGRLSAALAKVCPRSEGICETSRQPPQAACIAHDPTAESEAQDTRKTTVVGADVARLRSLLRQSLTQTACSGKLAAALACSKSQAKEQQVERLRRQLKHDLLQAVRNGKLVSIDKGTQQETNVDSLHNGAKHAMAQSATDTRLDAMQDYAACNMEHNTAGSNSSCSDQLRGRNAVPDCKVRGLCQQLRQTLVQATRDGSLGEAMPTSAPSTSEDTTARACSADVLERTKNRARCALQSAVCSGQLDVQLAGRAREKAQSALTAVTKSFDAASTIPCDAAKELQENRWEGEVDSLQDLKETAIHALERALLGLESNVGDDSRLDVEAETLDSAPGNAQLDSELAASDTSKEGEFDEQKSVLREETDDETSVVSDDLKLAAIEALELSLVGGPLDTESDSLEDVELKEAAMEALDSSVLGGPLVTESDAMGDTELKEAAIVALETSVLGGPLDTESDSLEDVELKEAAIKALEVSVLDGPLETESDSLEDTELKEAAIEALETSVLGGPLDTASDSLEDTELKEAAIKALEVSVLDGPLDTESDSLEDTELKEAAIEALETSVLGWPLDTASDSLEDTELKEAAIEALETSLLGGAFGPESDSLDDDEASESSAIGALEALLPSSSSSDESAERLEKIRLNAKIALDVALLAMQDSDSEDEAHPPCVNSSPTESSWKQQREHLLPNSRCTGRVAEVPDLRADLKRLAALEAEAERQAEEAKRQAQREQELECQRLLEKQRAAEERAIAQQKAREEQVAADKQRKDHMWTLVEQQRKERHSRSTDVATFAQHLETQHPGRKDGEAPAKPKKPSTPLRDKLGILRRRSAASLREAPTPSSHRSGSQSTGELLSTQKQNADSDTPKDSLMHGSDSLTEFEATVRRQNDKCRMDNDEMQRENDRLRKLKEYSEEASLIGRANERMRSDLRMLLASNSRKAGHSSSQRMLNRSRGMGSSVAV